MTRALDRAADGLEGLVRAVGHLTAWTGLALVLLVAANVLLRYLAGVSSVGAQEAEWHVMALTALFGVSYALAQGSEVRVDLLYERYPARARAAVDLLSAAMLTAICGGIAWLSIGYVEQSYSIGEGSPDPGGLANRWLLKAAMPAAFVLLGLQGFAQTLRAWARLLKPG